MDVLKEEDNLENLLDEESEAALESAMQEEKTYLWQIEREEMQDEQVNFNLFCSFFIYPFVVFTRLFRFSVRSI